MLKGRLIAANKRSLHCLQEGLHDGDPSMIFLDGWRLKEAQHGVYCGYEIKHVQPHLGQESAWRV